MKYAIIIVMMFSMLGVEAQKKREFTLNVDTITGDSLNKRAHCDIKIKKVYQSTASYSLEQLNSLIDNCDKVIAKYDRAITPLKSAWVSVEAEIPVNEADSLKRSEDMLFLKETYIPISNSKSYEQSRRDEYEKVKQALIAD
jgi:hypothetical protein